MQHHNLLLNGDTSARCQMVNGLKTSSFYLIVNDVLNSKSFYIPVIGASERFLFTRATFYSYVAACSIYRHNPRRVAYSKACNIDSVVWLPALHQTSSNVGNDHTCTNGDKTSRSTFLPFLGMPAQDSVVVTVKLDAILRAITSELQRFFVDFRWACIFRS